jgi:hypothetical protein
LHEETCGNCRCCRSSIARRLERGGASICSSTKGARFCQKRGGISAFAEGWVTAKEGEARACAPGLRPVSPEEETLVRNLADAAESFLSIEGADLNPLMERIRNRVREPLFPGPICRSNSTKLAR